MASDDVANLADSLAKTQVNEGELSYKGQGLKLDNAQSGELKRTSAHNYRISHICFWCLYERINLCFVCSGGDGEGDRGVRRSACAQTGGKHHRRGGGADHRQSLGEEERSTGAETTLTVLIFTKLHPKTVILH